jgi:hypothetical protein
VQMQDECPGWRPSCFIVDACAAEMNAIREVFGEEMPIFICTWHFFKALKKQLNCKVRLSAILALLNRLSSSVPISICYIGGSYMKSLDTLSNIWNSFNTRYQIYQVYNSQLLLLLQGDHVNAVPLLSVGLMVPCSCSCRSRALGLTKPKWSLTFSMRFAMSWPMSLLISVPWMRLPCFKTSRADSRPFWTGQTLLARQRRWAIARRNGKNTSVRHPWLIGVCASCWHEATIINCRIGATCQASLLVFCIADR